MVKNPPANAGDAKDASSMPGLGRSPEKEMGTCSSILAWEIPWTEETGGLQSIIWSCEHTAINVMSCFCFRILPRAFYM